MRQREDLRNWLGLHKREETEKEDKRNKEESPSMARFILITGKQRKALEFQAIGGGKNAWFP